MRRERWSELTPGQRAAIALLAAAQIALLAAAQLDLRRRPAYRIRGSKSLWTALSFINFAGPIAYFLFGRRRQPLAARWRLPP